MRSRSNQPELIQTQDPDCFQYGDYRIKLVYEEEGDSLETLLLQYLRNLWEKEE